MPYKNTGNTASVLELTRGQTMDDEGSGQIDVERDVYSLAPTRAKSTQQADSEEFFYQEYQEAMGNEGPVYEEEKIPTEEQRNRYREEFFYQEHQGAKDHEKPVAEEEKTPAEEAEQRNKYIKKSTYKTIHQYYIMTGLNVWSAIVGCILLSDLIRYTHHTSKCGFQMFILQEAGMI